MTVHRVRVINVDGNKIGKTWNEWFFSEKKDAEFFLKKQVHQLNENETDIGRAIGRVTVQYLPDIVDGIQGYCCWRDGIMICYDYITVK